MSGWVGVGVGEWMDVGKNHFNATAVKAIFLRTPRMLGFNHKFKIYIHSLLLFPCLHRYLFVLKIVLTT